jgi:hypothetical protein
VSQANIHRVITVALGIGLGSIAAYLNTHGDKDTFWLWVGVSLCCWVVLA